MAEAITLSAREDSDAGVLYFGIDYQGATFPLAAIPLQEVQARVREAAEQQQQEQAATPSPTPEPTTPTPEPTPPTPEPTPPEPQQQ